MFFYKNRFLITGEGYTRFFVFSFFFGKIQKHEEMLPRISFFDDFEIHEFFVSSNFKNMKKYYHEFYFSIIFENHDFFGFSSNFKKHEEIIPRIPFFDCF